MIRLLIADDEALEREKNVYNKNDVWWLKKWPQSCRHGGAVGRRPDPDGH